MPVPDQRYRFGQWAQADDARMPRPMWMACADTGRRHLGLVVDAAIIRSAVCHALSVTVHEPLDGEGTTMATLEHQFAPAYGR